jgi:hypothetical protein
MAIEGWKFHYSEKNQLLILANDENNQKGMDVPKDGKEQRELLTQFIQHKNRGNLVLLQKCPSGNVFFSSEAGEISIYTWNPKVKLIKVKRFFQYKNGSAPFEHDPKADVWFENIEDATTYMQASDSGIGGDMRYDYAIEEETPGKKTPVKQYPFNGQDYDSEAARSQAARNHPLWNTFCSWNATKQCGKPNINEDFDRLLFEAFLEGSAEKTPSLEKIHSLITAAEALNEDAQVFGLAGETNHPAVKCEVKGLCLKHWYDLRTALTDLAKPKPTAEASAKKPSYLVIFEDGTLKTSDILLPELTTGATDGILTLIDVSNPSKPITWNAGAWEPVKTLEE